MCTDATAPVVADDTDSCLDRLGERMDIPEAETEIKKIRLLCRLFCAEGVS